MVPEVAIGWVIGWVIGPGDRAVSEGADSVKDMEHEHGENQDQRAGGSSAAALPTRVEHLASEPELATGWELLVAARQAEAKTIVSLLAYQDRREREALAAALPFHERRAARDAAVRDAALILGASEPVTSGVLTAARTARAEMPATWRAFTAGLLETVKMRTIARAGLGMLRPADVETLDAAASAAAQRLTAGELRSWLRRFIARVNPAQHAEQCAQSRADRWVRVQHDDDAMSYLEARLPTVTAAAIENRLRAAARGQANPIPLPPGTEPGGSFTGGLAPSSQAHQLTLDVPGPTLVAEFQSGDTGEIPLQVQDGPEILAATAGLDEPDVCGTGDARTLGQREADLFAAWLLDGRVAGAPVEAKIAIMIPEATLTGDSEAPGVSADRRWAIPAADARRLAAQGETPDGAAGQGTARHEWYEARHSQVHDTTGDEAEILSVVYRGRYAPVRLRDAITFRDGTCQAPGCAVPAQRCDLDHQIPHPEGPTTGSNLWALCRRHHRLKSHGYLSAPQPEPDPRPVPEPDPEPNLSPEPEPSDVRGGDPFASAGYARWRLQRHRLPRRPSVVSGPVDLIHCTSRIRI